MYNIILSFFHNLLCWAFLFLGATNGMLILIKDFKRQSSKLLCLLEDLCLTVKTSTYRKIFLKHFYSVSHSLSIRN